MKTAPALALLLGLAACGRGDDAVENTADQLENAAEQSDPAAAEVLENAADEVREQNSTAAASGALEEAANAQAPNRPQPEPPPVIDKPKQPEDGAPPPKTYR
jgi:outer membrane biosynthesis protein TonB